ncbi:MAG: hypothetical protein DMG90_14475 [Acidobacteria bacterium]|nr:MAG: hypothetical protein DMG90_14475 [Acidobacteriota bacterium]
MNVHVSYKVHKTPDIEKEINHLIEKLQRRLQVFRPELVHLKGIVEENSPREGFVVSLNLRLPSGQMAAQSSAPNAPAAIKSALNDLLQQVTRHKDALRSSHKWRRARANRVEPQVPFEATLAAVHPPAVSADDVRSYVNINLGRLEKFIERELYFRESSGETLANSITRDEVLDEVIARALDENNGAKPDRLALEPWLYRLALSAMTELARRAQEDPGSVHLEDYAGTRNVGASDEPALQFHQPDEAFTGENVIADTRLATPEQIAYSDEMVTLVQAALRGAQPREREAFILFSLEGFSVGEIAAITDHPHEEVEKSIQAARAHLRRSPPIPNPYKEKLLQRTGTV